jgi:hypothetical protein
MQQKSRQPNIQSKDPNASIQIRSAIANARARPDVEPGRLS